MVGKKLSAGDRLLLAAFVAAGALFVLSGVYSGSPVAAPSAAYAEGEGTVPVNVVGGEGGEVTVNGNVALRIRVSAGGLSAEERAVVVRDRLQDLLNGGIEPSDVHAGMIRGQAAVMAGAEIIVTVDSTHARLNSTTPAKLATVWARNVAGAMGGEPGASTVTSDAAQTVTQWRPAEPYSDKDVPIISIGRGIRIGMARVTGPRSKVRTVQAVAQLESRLAKFGDVEIYVPISTKTPGKTLDRVKECAVVGLAALKL